MQTVLLAADGMQRALSRIAHEIIERHPSPGELLLLGIRQRGLPLAERLASFLEQYCGERPLLGELDIRFYRDDIERSEEKLEQPILQGVHLPCDLKDRKVILVDDVLYTGRTCRAAIEALFDCGRPAVIQLAVMIDRGHRELPIRPDYVGKNVPTSRQERVFVQVQEVDGRDQILLEGREEAK